MKRPRRRRNDPEGLRGRILDAAAAAFQAAGYHATSTHDVMHAIGISGGAFHHHFPTKKSLGLAVIRERVAPAVEETWIAPVKAGRTAVEGILNVFGAITDGLDKRGRVLGCPLNNIAIELSLADREFQAAIAAVFDGWRDAIAAKVRADQGGKAPLDPAAIATFVVAAYSGAIAMAKAKQSSEPLKICARQLAALFRSPVRARR
jgi:AcrR family transcriptional regulator